MVVSTGGRELFTVEGGSGGGEGNLQGKGIPIRVLQ